MALGPGDIVAGLAPPQDNLPAYLAQSMAAKPRLHPYEEERRRRQKSSEDGEEGETPSTEVAEAKTEDGAHVEPSSPSYAPLAGYILSSWARNKRARDTLEIRLLACLWARRGEYSDDQLSTMWTVEAGAGDPIYLPVAASKMRSAEAALRDLLLPDGQRPWGVEPVPFSALPEDIMAKLTQQAEQKMVAQMGEQAQSTGQTMQQNQFKQQLEQHIEELKASATELARKEALKRAGRMENTIEKRMQEGGYYQAIADLIQHFCTFPTAVLKGPYKSMKRRRKWEGNKMVVSLDPIQIWSAPNPMDCYPAPGASGIQDGDFIERLRLTRSDLYEMIGLPGYDENAIRRVLANHDTGGLRAWLWSDMERRRIEGQTNSTWIPDYQIDALHYWGSVQGKDLKLHGIHEGVDDLLAYYEVDAVLIGNEVIRCELNNDPLGQRPYWNASYDEVPGAFWGNSIYELIRAPCDMINACARALNANMALASGPIMGVDMSQLAAGQDPKAIRPLLQFQLDTSLTSTPRPPLTFYQADSRSEELLKIIMDFETKADELSGIPRYLSGDARATGAAETLGGLSMLMGNAAKGLRRAVANVDRQVIGPTLTKVYDYEMETNPDEGIKGACEIVARGSAAVLIKEHLQQIRTQLLQEILRSEKLQSILGDERIANLLRSIVDSQDLNAKDIVPTEEEMQQRTAALARQGPPPPSPDEQLRAQVKEKEIASKERVAGGKGAISLAEHKLTHSAALASKPPSPNPLTPGTAPNPNAQTPPG
jgi:hypothetical protein